jgi:8-oxo-dGTP diphosphatase
LIGALAAFGISEIHSSDSRRCRDTVGPYATARSLAVTLEKSVSEERHQEHPEKVKALVAELVTQSNPLVLCTHRPVMPTVMESLAESFKLETETKKSFDPALTPGSMVIYHRDAADLTKVLSVERHLH